MIHEIIKIVALLLGFIAVIWITLKLNKKSLEPYEAYDASRVEDRATAICKKLNSKEKLSLLESVRLENFICDGIILLNEDGVYGLSKKARTSSLIRRTNLECNRQGSG